LLTIEEIEGKFIGIGMLGKILVCNTIPLPTQAEAEADLKATCISAWGDSLDFYWEFYTPEAYKIARYIYNLFVGRNPGPRGFDILPHYKTKFWNALLTISSIPRGRFTTYGELARAINTSPRATGNYAARNPYPLIIPCHRVVRSDMRLGGYSYGPIIKASLLMNEGVTVNLDTGKVDPSKLIRAEELIKLRKVLKIVGYE